MKLFFELFFILFGLFIIFFHSRIVTIGIGSWDAVYPKKRVSRKGLKIIFLGAGIVFVIFGLAAVFGIIEVK